VSPGMVTAGHLSGRSAVVAIAPAEITTEDLPQTRLIKQVVAISAVCEMPLRAVIGPTGRGIPTGTCQCRLHIVDNDRQAVCPLSLENCCRERDWERRETSRLERRTFAVTMVTRRMRILPETPRTLNGCVHYQGL
jgi:hypothetical protein